MISQKKNLVQSERFETENSSLHKGDIAKKKVEKQKWLVEKRKNQHEICQTSKRKKYYQDHNFECSQTNESKVKSTYDNTQIDNNKFFCKKTDSKQKQTRETEMAS